jgi:DNA-directed RNA polymerase specialized sigma24 family protein
MLMLRYESRASMHEVARAMGQSFEGVTKTLYRVRRALLECVERKLSKL